MTLFSLDPHLHEKKQVSQYHPREASNFPAELILMVEEVTIELNMYKIGLEHALLGLFWGSMCWEAKKRLLYFKL